MAAELTDERLDQIARKHAIPGHATMIDHRGAMREAVALAAQQATQGAELVGHVCFVAHRKAPDVEWAANVDIRNGAALYTAPPPTAELPTLSEEQVMEAGYDLLCDLAGIDTHETNLRDCGEAYLALDRYRARLQSDQAQAGKGDGNG